MAKKKMVLEQVSDEGWLDEGLIGAGEGDQIGKFEVIHVEEVECDHPRRNWRVRGEDVDSETRVVGKCSICGDRMVVSLSTLKKLVESGNTDVNLRNVIIESEE